jgi:hypothetical protein
MGAECTEHGRDPQLDFCEPCDEVSNHPDRRRRSRALRGTSKNVGRKRAASSQDVASPYARVYDSAEGSTMSNWTSRPTPQGSGAESRAESQVPFRGSVVRETWQEGKLGTLG